MKFIHSLVFLFGAACVLYILYAGMSGSSGLLLNIALGFLVLEVFALLLNRGRCPLTSLALRLGDSTGDDLIADYLLPKPLVRCIVPCCSFLAGVGLVLLGLRYL